MSRVQVPAQANIFYRKLLLQDQADSHHLVAIFCKREMTSLFFCFTRLISPSRVKLVKQECRRRRLKRKLSCGKRKLPKLPKLLFLGRSNEGPTNFRQKVFLLFFNNLLRWLKKAHRNLILTLGSSLLRPKGCFHLNRQQSKVFVLSQLLRTCFRFVGFRLQ